MGQEFYNLHRVKPPASITSDPTPPVRWSDGTVSFRELSNDEANLLDSLDNGGIFTLLEWASTGHRDFREHKGKHLVVKSDLQPGDAEKVEDVGAFTAVGKKASMQLLNQMMWMTVEGFYNEEKLDGTRYYKES